MVGSKEIDTINKSEIYDTYKDIYLNEKEHEHEEKLLQGIQCRQMPSKRRLINGLQYR